MNVAVKSNNQHLLPRVLLRIWMRQNVQQPITLNRNNDSFERKSALSF